MVKRRTSILASILMAAAAIPLVAGDVTLVPVQDNTLYEVILQAPEGEIPPSNGAGDFFFAGRTNFTGESRRGVLAFDVANTIPPGSVVTAVTLTLEMSRTISGPTMVELHRVTSDWGEGTSDAPGQEGVGAPATPGDATWIHTFFPGSLWATEGGDFSPTVSAAQSVGSVGPYTWGSTPEMVADVQAWLDDPATNFGWLVMGDELTAGSAKRFNTRENGSGVPQLAVTFQAPVPTAPTWALVALALVLGALAVWRLRRAALETDN